MDCHILVLEEEYNVSNCSLFNIVHYFVRNREIILTCLKIRESSFIDWHDIDLTGLVAINTKQASISKRYGEAYEP